MTLARPANELILGLINNLAAQEFLDAKEVARKAIQTLKARLVEKPAEWSDSDMNIAFTATVFLRAAYDYAVLQGMVSEPDWIHDHDKIERIWSRFCNCRDRFQFAKGCFHGPMVEHISKSLTCIENIFLENFGSGHYMSCSLIFEKIDLLYLPIRYSRL
jgi:hypothetical protein